MVKFAEFRATNACIGNEPTLKSFETELLKACIPVTEDLFEQMSLAVQLLSEQASNAIAISSRVEIPEDNVATNNSVNVNAWLPTLRNPEDLYVAYYGQTEKLSTASKIAALTDLRLAKPSRRHRFQLLLIYLQRFFRLTSALYCFKSQLFKKLTALFRYPKDSVQSKIF